MKSYKIDQYFEFTFQTQRFDTGAATDADATPTYRVYEENNDTVIANGDAAKRDDANTTGYYYCRAQCTTAAGYEVGKTYEVRVAATVNSVAGAGVVGRFAILPDAVWDSLYGGTDKLPVDVQEVSSDSTAADNLELACDNYSATRGLTGTALPAAAADAAGGLPISDAGGLDLDAKLANTNEVTAARMGALTDWINGGRLDLILDDILTDTGTTLDALIKDVPTVAEFEARTIPSANYALDATVAKAATALSNAIWTDAKAGYLTGSVALEATLTAIKGAGWTTETLAAIDALIDAIKAKTDTIPASPAAVGSAMTLADDAITAAKFDESTAFPLKSADTGATSVARTGADGDTLETLSDQVDGTATTTELNKVPKSDGSTTWNATALASINAEVDTALNTAIPGSPTADSINERIVAIDGYGAPPSAAANADAVWDEAIAGHAGAGSTGAALAAATAPSAAAVADAVWDEAIVGHLGAGSTGAALNAAGSAGDPWSTPLPGAYGAGTAGKIIGDNINAPIGTVDTVVDAIKAKTDNLPSDPADQSAVEAAITAAVSALATSAEIDALPTAAENAAALLDLSNAIETDVTLRIAMRVLLAALGGVGAGGGTTALTFKNLAESKTRLSMTVDANGNRSNVVYDGT